MQKNYFLFLMFLASFLLPSCEPKENEPDGDSCIGKWYCTEEKGEMSLKLNVVTFEIDTVIRVDTAFTAPYPCFTLTKDGYLLVETDTMAGYAYYEKDAILRVSTKQMLSRMQIPPMMADMIAIPDSVDASFNYTATTGRGEIHLAESGMLMDMLPYSYSFTGRAYFQRSAE